MVSRLLVSQGVKLGPRLLASHMVPAKCPNLLKFHSMSPMIKTVKFNPMIYRHPAQSIGSSSVKGGLGIFRHLLKLRYWIFGGAVGGGYAVSTTMKEKMEWLNQYLPDTDRWKSYADSVSRYVTDFRFPDDSIFRKGLDGLRLAADWLDEKTQGDMSVMFNEDGSTVKQFSIFPDGAGNAKGSAKTSEESTGKNTEQELQDQLLKVQIQYQQEIEKLEKDNQELRRQILLSRSQKTSKPVKMSLIDLYSDVLDELSDYEGDAVGQDHLPRVVVVGDQSAGKTSVLEMVAQARIFPRGGGEMMTRSPVKVTLSEGPYHVARFKDSQREFDLTQESELAALRREIELRMRANVRPGETISNQVISLSVQGPGIQRMVLVDLPGIISTQTLGMAQDTKQRIQTLAKGYMENPNAIILCIQDGSIDAERSNVTDIVSEIDPAGKRTIFVLTKVDQAEANLLNPDRIRQILDGKLFPMMALGYFAVITGKGQGDESISSIRKYEEEFFQKSKLFKEGVLKPSQMTTRNLSMAVSKCFWNMVRESIEQQADTFKARRFNLETEWKNSFPNTRQMARDELYEKARSEILDNVMNLNQIPPQEWEEAIHEELWKSVRKHVFDSIYYNATEATDGGAFNTTVDIKLRHWVDKMLPNKAIEVGGDVLMAQFGKMLEMSVQDQLYDKLKGRVVNEMRKRHQWENKALSTLRIMQQSALEDRVIPDKRSWGESIVFLDRVLREQRTLLDEQLNEACGPSTSQQWLHWKRLSEAQRASTAIRSELQLLFTRKERLQQNLGNDEVTAVRKNLETKGVSVEGEQVRELWKSVFRYHLLGKAVTSANDCKKGFYHYQKGFADVQFECQDVVLFWRIQKMLDVTSNALRQQLVNVEERRLEREISDILDEFSTQRDEKKSLLTGKRVDLAEDIQRVRRIQEKLEQFIDALNKEKPVR